MPTIKITNAAATALRGWAQERGARVDKKEPGADGLVEIEVDAEALALLNMLDADHSAAIGKLTRTADRLELYVPMQGQLADLYRGVDRTRRLMLELLRLERDLTLDECIPSLRSAEAKELAQHEYQRISIALFGHVPGGRA